MEASEFGGRGRRSEDDPGAVWLRDEPERSRRSPPLSRERIVDAAVALLVQHGIDRLTMRRLARRLEGTARPGGGRGGEW